MLPFEFIDELPEVEPLIELPDDDEEPLPIVLPEPLVLPEPMVEPVPVPVPVPIVLPEPVVDGVVLLFDVDEDGLVVPMVLLPGVVVVVVVVLGVPIVPVLVLPDGVVVVLLPDGVDVVLLPDGEVVLLPDGVVVVLEPVLDCATAAPPAINNDAAARAVVVLKNEPMVRTPVWLKRKAHRSAAVQSSAMSDALPPQQRMCPTARCARGRWSPSVRACPACRLLVVRHTHVPEVSMVTSSSSFPSSPSTSSSSAVDYTRSSSEDAIGTAGSASSAGSMSSTLHPSSSTAASATPELMDRVVRGAHETVDKLADKAKPQLQRLQEGAGNASDSIHARVDQAREMGDEWAESLRSTVREHPLAALGTALALGLVIARLSR